MSVDWNAPLEAVHEDGRVVPMVADGVDPAGDRMTKDSPEGCSNRYWKNDGRDCVYGTGWRIRNVSVESTLVDPNYAMVRKLDHEDAWLALKGSSGSGPERMRNWLESIGLLSDPKPAPELPPLTITITGPQGSGKTRWAELIRSLPMGLLGYPVPVIVDGEEG